jgi:hypothetical protein
LCDVELGGKPLIFVLKLDEAEIVHGQKLERVSITLMNRALNNNIEVGSPKYFAVQSEREIWPIGCFQVRKESHEVLSWVFSQTKIPALIGNLNNGQLLCVPRVGDFKVEWASSCRYENDKMHVRVKSWRIFNLQLYILLLGACQAGSRYRGTSIGCLW